MDTTIDTNENDMSRTQEAAIAVVLGIGIYAVARKVNMAHATWKYNRAWKRCEKAVTELYAVQ
jgi:hypothetical protein